MCIVRSPVSLDHKLLSQIDRPPPLLFADLVSSQEHAIFAADAGNLSRDVKQIINTKQ